MNDKTGTATGSSQIKRLVRRYELDKYKKETNKLAGNSKCQGDCGEHFGEVKPVRVVGPSGNDWGWFSYCEVARAEDKKRGLRLIYV